MLRSLVVLILGVNVALFFWIRANPTWGEADREPQRLQRQVSPASIQVLPDLPASGASAPAVPASGGELSFAPPAAGLPVAPQASAASAGSIARPASAPHVTALRRPSAATAGRGAASR